MTGDGGSGKRRIANEQRPQRLRQTTVLRTGVRSLVRALEFDADGEVVAIRPASVARHAGMPRAPVEWHELRQRTAPREKQVAGNPRAREARQRFASADGQLATEEAFHVAGTEAARRQRDAVDDDQGYVRRIGALVHVRGGTPRGAAQPMIVRHGEHILANMTPAHAEVNRAVAAALGEDVGSGDINARLVSCAKRGQALVTTREVGVFCGKPWVAEACRLVDSRITLDWRVNDGDDIAEGDLLLTMIGPARALLTVERTALNFMQLLSGVASRARAFVRTVAETGVVVLDTRKTLPSLRAAQKYAVRVGGARNHRMGLYDAYLLKENHITAAGGIAPALREARRQRPGIEVVVEVETSDQLREAIALGADRVLLDNHSLAALREAVKITAGRVPLEASGDISLTNVTAVARTGVDYISVGKLTKDVAPLNLSMRLTLAANAD